jgi:hypothetical protein
MNVTTEMITIVRLNITIKPFVPGPIMPKLMPDGGMPTAKKMIYN